MLGKDIHRVVRVYVPAPGSVSRHAEYIYIDLENSYVLYISIHTLHALNRTETTISFQLNLPRVIYILHTTYYIHTYSSNKIWDIDGVPLWGIWIGSTTHTHTHHTH